MADSPAMHSPRMIFEPASLGDLPGILDVLAAGSYEPSKSAEGLKALIMRPELGFIFVARGQARILAVATLLINVSTAEGGLVAMVGDFIVDPAYRNQGIGTRLLETVRDYANAQKLSRITLMPQELTPASRQFFQKRGFATSGMVAMHLSLEVLRT